MSKSALSMLNVVVIDDDELVLKSLANTLRSLDISTTPFQDPNKALSFISKNKCDIVITDICMPTLDGFDVLKKVKELDHECDVIFITAHGQLDIAIRALREGVTDFFEKPITASMLEAAMERTSKVRALIKKKDILEETVNILRNQINNDSPIMLGNSPIMKKIADSIISVASTNATVLLTGESGTGKELAARAIHNSSSFANGPFVTVNCPSIPEDLFESEMFGHKKGSFTGALTNRIGYVQAAENGTLFLDEIGDMPLKLQSKILRLLEQKTYQSVGDPTEHKSNARVIAATNQSLPDMIAKKKFREDLYYRLNVCPIKLPPLRERKEDIPLLSLYFTLRFASDMKKPINGISKEAINILSKQYFAGNIRELRNVIESSVIHCKHSGDLLPEDLRLMEDIIVEPSKDNLNIFDENISFAEVEKQLYLQTLKRTANNVSAAARILGLSRAKLRRRLEALDIKPDNRY